MPWNIPVFDSTGKIKDAGLGLFKSASGTATITELTASGTSSVPATFIVRAGGGEDFTTLQGAIDAVSPGDIIEVHADTPGGTQTFLETMRLNTTNKGAPGNYITIRAKVNDEIIVSAPTNTVSIGFDVAEYWVLEDLTAGIEAQWTPQSTSGPDSGWTPSRQWDLNGVCHHIVFRRCTTMGGNQGFRGNHMDTECHHIWLDNCLVHKQGSNNRQDQLPDVGDAGDLFDCFASNVLITDSTFRYGGHDIFSIYGNWIRVVNNDFDAGGWTAIHSNGDVDGTRVGNISSGQENREKSAPYGMVSMRHNKFHGTGASMELGAGVHPNTAFKMQAVGISMYDNIMYDNGTEGFFNYARGNEPDGPGFHEDSRVFHNTMYDSGEAEDANAGLKDFNKTGFGHKWMNNAFKLNGGNRIITYAWGYIADGDNLSTVPDTEDPDSTTWSYNTNNGWMDWEFHKNLFETPGDNASMRARPDSTNNWDWFIDGSIKSSITSPSPAWPGVPIASIEGVNTFGNRNATFTFVNAGARTRAGFQLVSGDGVGEAVPLTTMVGAEPTPTTDIVLADALPFFVAIAYDLDEWAESDEIKIGSNAPVKLVTMDYVTGIGTIETAQTWDDGDPVIIDGFVNVGIGPA